MGFADQLKQLRKEHKVRQRDLAKRAGIPQSRLSDIEAGRVEADEQTQTLLLELLRSPEDHMSPLADVHNLFVVPSSSEPGSSTPDRVVGEGTSSDQVPGRNGNHGEAQRLDSPTPSEKSFQEIYIPVHNLIRLTRREMAILNHPALQRLGSVYQLGQVHLVYRGATHRRLEHVLGTVHVVQMMIDSVNRNAEQGHRSEVTEDFVLDVPISPLETEFFRLGALLHDIGHLPAGHTLEDELGLLAPHDADERLNLVLNRMTWRGVPVAPTLRDLIDREYAAPAAETGVGKSATEIVLDLVSKDRAGADYSAPFRVAVGRDMIGNTICADLLDYLIRDWYHLGKPRHFDSRLLEYMEVRRALHPRPEEPASKFVVYLRNRDRVRTDAVTAILDLLESRYQLGEIALFHRTKIVAAAMLERLVGEVADDAQADRDAWLRQTVDALLDCTDEEMLEFFATAARGRGRRSPRARGIESLARRLQLRHLHKTLHAVFEFDLAHDVGHVQRNYSGPEGAANRLRAVRSIEEDFGLPVGSVVMYSPSRKPHIKIAQVKILLDDAIHELSEYEDGHRDSGLTGGHLAAQETRYWRLWRLVVAVSPEAIAHLRETDQLPLLSRTINDLVLGRRVSGVSLEDAALSIGRDLSRIPGSALEGAELAPVVGNRASHVTYYPSGAPTLRSLRVS